MSGCSWIACVTVRANSSRSTASAAPGGHARDFGGVHHERIQPAHLLFQQSDRVVELVAAERVAADELGETVGLVDVGGPDGPHFVDGDGNAARGSLPGSLAAGQAAANDADWA